MQRGEDRREFQRLDLDPPVPGSLGATAVSIVEVGVLGARLRHAERVVETFSELRFSHRGEEIALRCEVVRTPPGEGGLESGVRFIAAVGESGDRLRTMLGELVTRIIDTRRHAPM